MFIKYPSNSSYDPNNSDDNGILAEAIFRDNGSIVQKYPEPDRNPIKIHIQISPDKPWIPMPNELYDDFLDILLKRTKSTDELERQALDLGFTDEQYQRHCKFMNNIR